MGATIGSTVVQLFKTTKQVITVRPLMQTFVKNFKLIIVNLINMIQLQLIDFFSIFSMFLSLFSNVTAVEYAATTTSAR